MVLAGQPWVNALIHKFDSSVEVTWLKNDGDTIEANEVFLKLSGSARSLLTVERAALNFIQTLSAVATKTTLRLSKGIVTDKLPSIALGHLLQD